MATNKVPFPIIGLEIHVELKTQSKMFCQCSADYFGAKANSHVCPVCLGMPGALPVPNKTAVEWTVRIAQALQCSVQNRTKFDRKHYFYPDLPKGYQISQYDEPIGQHGSVTIFGDGSQEKTFRIRRVHLEEDTGKLSHSDDGTQIDFNRSSVPLVEIVTEPDFHNAEDVRAFLTELQMIIRYLDVANADMEKGDMRLEPNISVLMMPEGETWDEKKFPPYKVEVKNINSFRFAKMAVEQEIARHTVMLEAGETPIQETRGFNEKKMKTVSQRVKEEAADYRYFPEPDIPPITFTDDFLKHSKESLPELPHAKAIRFMSEFGIKAADAATLIRSRAEAEYFEHAVQKTAKEVKGKSEKEIGQKVANFIVNKKIKTDISVEAFSQKAAAMMAGVQTNMGKLTEVAKAVIAEHPNVAADYKSGKENAIMFLVGQVMRQMRGQADANTVIETLKKHI